MLARTARGIMGKQVCSILTMAMALSANLPPPPLLATPLPSCPLGQHCGGAQSQFY